MRCTLVGQSKTGYLEGGTHEETLSSNDNEKEKDQIKKTSGD